MTNKEAIRILNNELECDKYVNTTRCLEINCDECEYFNLDSQLSDALQTAIKALETVIKHQETFEWCHDCKEYDQENYCCHRWNKCIRETISDSREHWYNEGFEDGKIHACSEGALREAYEQGYDEGYVNGYNNAE